MTHVPDKGGKLNHVTFGHVTLRFTVVKSQATLIIRLGVAEVISAVSLYLLPASKRRNSYLVGYVQAQQFCVWTLLIDRRFDSNDVSV